MVLSKFFKPRWQHRKPEERLAAITGLTDQDEAILLTLAIEDEDGTVRQAAFDRLDGMAALREIISRSADADLKRKAGERLNRMARQGILEGRGTLRFAECLSMIDDAETLKILILETQDVDLRLLLLEKITDESVLARLVEQECGKAVAQEAVKKISDETLLKKIADQGANKTARRLAASRLGLGEEPPPSEEELLQEKLSGLATLAGKLQDSLNWDLANERFQALTEQWQQLDPESTHPLAGQFSAARDHFAARFKEHVEEMAIERQRQEERQAILTRCEQCLGLLENYGKNPETLPEEGLDAVDRLWQESSAGLDLNQERDIADIFRQARDRIVQAMAAMAADKNARQRLQGAIEKIQAQLPKDYNAAARLFTAFEKEVAAFKPRRGDAGFPQESVASLAEELAARKTQLEAEREASREADLAQREAICLEIESLTDARERNTAEQRVKELQTKWVGIANFSDEAAQPLVERYNLALTHFYDKQREFYSEQDWQRWTNRNLKEELIALVDSLDSEEDIEKVATVVKDAQARWKTIGPVPKDQAQKMWNSFHAACERHFIRCKPYFEELDRRREEITLRKEAITLQAEELVESEKWKETTETLKTLQTEWNSLGPLPMKVEQPLHAKFRKACNRFFERRRVHLDEVEKVRSEHFQIKSGFCEQVEAMIANPQWHHGQEIRTLQQKWKETGTVSRDQEEKLWKRFRGACDRYYAWLDQDRQANLELKEKLCQELEELIDNINAETNMRQVALKISELQQRWKEIGPVPKEQKDAIWNRFRGKCDSFFHDRREHFQQLDSKREDNLVKMRELLHQAEEAAGGSDTKAAAETLRGLQEQWKAIGAGKREEETELRLRFHEICNNFFEGRRTHFDELTRSRMDNLKKKESLCFQLEKLLNIAPGDIEGGQVNAAFSLAEQLKLALETNTLLGAQQSDQKVIKSEVHRIQQEWKIIGPVPREYDRSLQKRYRGALDLFYERMSQGNRR